MPQFKLGTHQLPPGEVVLIQTLMRLFSRSNGFGWTFSNVGPFDAIIVDDAKTSESNTALDARVVLRLTPASSEPAPNTLQRPIKAEKLQEWLKSTEAELALRKTAAMPPASAPALMAHARFRLLRWPPHALLQNDAKLIRMATLLSRRALELSELTELSHLPFEACQQFIEKLLPTQLLAFESITPLTASPATRTAMPAQTPFHQGLFSGIRRRLGLSSSA